MCDFSDPVRDLSTPSCPYVCMSQKPQTLKCPTKTKPNQMNSPEQNKTKENKKRDEKWDEKWDEK